MALKIEDYALIGNTRTAALVGRDGSIDWLCVPRFDSNACFAALLGTEENGRWIIAPKNSHGLLGKRKYWDDSLVLETVFETPTGKIRIIDCMITDHSDPTVIRIVEGLEGEVAMHTEIVIRFDYGSAIPWVRKEDGGILAIAGPDNILLESDVKLTGKNFRTQGEFNIRKGEKKSFVLRYFEGTKSLPKKIKDPWEIVTAASQGWAQWCGQSTYSGKWKSQVMRSLMVLKALTYKPTGGIVAAPTTSLPELLGGERNWDYRYCWIRDATFTLYSMMVSGYTEEASQWREWLLRAIAGKPSQIKVLYGVAGERLNTELEIPWLEGYAKSKPVRIGNGAQTQFQIDVYGELADTLFLASKDLPPSPNRKQGWKLLCALIENLEKEWMKPDRGIWEIRGEPQHFVHSKVMAWVALDRGVRIIEGSDHKGPLERWKELRIKIYNEIIEKGFNLKLNSFTQTYGSQQLDASLLMLPLVGFIDAKDPRMVGTVKAIENALLENGLVKRYVTNHKNIDGLTGSEGVFLPCSFWYVDNLYLQGRKEEAIEIFERLLILCNDVGLLSEEYDPIAKRMLGNFPQAFSHVSLINTAYNLSSEPGPADLRSSKKT